MRLNQTGKEFNSKICVVFSRILVDVFLPDGTKAAPNQLGRVAVKLPLPPGNMSTLYKNDDFFKKNYFEKFPVSDVK